MTTRRSFLGDLFKGAVALTVAPQIVTHGLGLVKRATDAEVLKYAQINPDYVNAPFEIKWFIQPGSYDSLNVGPPPKISDSSKVIFHRLIKRGNNGIARSYKKFVALKDNYPLRLDHNGNPVPHTIMKS